MAQLHIHIGVWFVSKTETTPITLELQVLERMDKHFFLLITDLTQLIIH